MMPSRFFGLADAGHAQVLDLQVIIQPLLGAFPTVAGLLDPAKGGHGIGNDA